MRPARLAAAAAAAAMALAAAPAPTDASHVSRCGTVVVTRNSGDGFFNVRTQYVTCAKASRKLKRWARSGYEPATGPRGFLCKVVKRYPEGDSRVGCKNGPRRISYDTGF